MLTTATNRLAGEKSPYLLQHQYNPVDWFPWGEEAFARARQENKPIFLSIGYSTCHWCHVMERESFENEPIAEYLNGHFISIKVDREERPDIDRIYMTAVQAMTGQGGWPLSCFLTPDLKPFFGGTYFPPQGRYGRIGFAELLEQVNQTWRARPGEVAAAADELHDKLKDYTTQLTGDFIMNARLLRDAAQQFKADYDAHHGGFGGAPKFPHPVQPRFLLRYGIRFKDADAVKMVLHTCERMAAGGICDQLGGGFHRYSVDERWLTPHFEKMLYDQAQLAQLYLDAFLVNRDERFAATVRQIIDYVLRDMTDPQGGFYSAEDADSEGREGKFYCWTLDELSNLLTPAELSAAARHFGISPDGNFVDHSDPDPLPGLNVLSVVNETNDPSDRIALASARRKMIERRAARVRPLRDDKVLAAWNGMMLGALARAAVVLGDRCYFDSARENFTFLQTSLWDPQDGALHHRWREGERDSVQLLDGFAHLLGGVLDYYEATLEPGALEFAVALADSMISKFYDAGNGGFYQSAPGESDVILRMKEIYDGAEPSGNSAAVISLLRLAVITGRGDFKDAAEKTLRLFAAQLNSAPQIAPNLLVGLDMFLHEPTRVAVAGPRLRSGGVLSLIHSVSQPNKVVCGVEGPVDAFTKSLPLSEKPLVYLCAGTACQPPTDDPEKVMEKLVSQ